MNKMDKKWQAQWIMDPEFYGRPHLNVFHKEMENPQLPKHRDDLKNRHMLVRKVFNLDRLDGQAPALLDITADDYYKLYINGHFVAQGPAPGYYFHYYYNRHDISAWLRPGRNVIAVHVYYQGLINRVWNSGDYRQGLIAELRIGGCLILKSDRSWKYSISKAYGSGGLIGYETQYLENIDARLLEPRWRDPDFDDREWQTVWENPADDHRLIFQETRPVDVYLLKPLCVTTKAPGHYLVDFGQEITGSLTMEAHGSKGQVIELRCGEEMADQDTVRYKMRCNCDYQEFWTLSGCDKDVLEFFDYKAFRYAEVIGPEGTVLPSTIAARVQHYPMSDSACIFESSNLLLNQIWQICRNGVKYGTQETYLDCPSREKGQYLGDAMITAPAHLYLSGDLDLYKKQIKDFALSSFICPGLMAVAPGSLMQEIADFSMLWPMQLLNYYRHSGDLVFLGEMAPIGQKVLDYFQQYARPDGLLEAVDEKWNLVDWPENLRDDYDFALTKPIGPGLHNVVNAFYIGLVDSMNQIKDILGIPYQNRLSQLKQAFIDTFYRKEQKLFVDSPQSAHASLHSNVLPLFFGIAEESTRPDIVSFIKGKKFSCGVYMSYFVLKALAGTGDFQAVYDLITIEERQSWANMLREGATTCFEAWGKDQKENTSLCHPWASAPIPVLIEDIIGLRPLTPGWHEICFKPHIPPNLQWLKLEFKSPACRIKVII